MTPIFSQTVVWFGWNPFSRAWQAAAWAELSDAE